MLRADGDSEVPEASSSPSRQNNFERRNLETTPQMHTLDSNQRRDFDEYYSSVANDGFDVISLPQSNGEVAASTKRWFPSLWTANRKADRTIASLTSNGDRLLQPAEVNRNGVYSESTNGKPPDADAGIDPGSPKRRSRRFPEIPSMGQQKYATLPSSSAIQESSSSNADFSVLHDVVPSPKVKETELQEDCSFFFRPLESDSNRSLNPGTQRRSHQDEHVWKVMRRDHHNRHPDALTYEYSDAVPVTPLPILQHYRNRFAQLNQELIGERLRLQQHYHHDRLEQERDPFDDWHLKQSSLQLQEHDSRLDQEADAYYNANLALNNLTPKSNRGIVRCDTARQSSLCFRADGRLLMRLPRDRVRLLVDPDLEVGVLSVEQWRVETKEDYPNEDEYDFYPRMNGEAEGIINTQSSLPSLQHGKMRMNRKAHRPELRYVLTVSDDLYRKIIEEMSPTSVKYFCCNRACCNDEEKMDIRVAFLLLLSILFILFINMLAFREH
jgi:hypothetical protein